MFKTAVIALFVLAGVAADASSGGSEQGVDAYESSGATVSSGKMASFTSDAAFESLVDSLSKPSGGNGLRGVAPVKELVDQPAGAGDRKLQQATNIEIVNNCGYAAYSASIYEIGRRRYTWSWPIINDGSSLTLQGITGPVFWVYGIRVSDFANVWKSSGNSEYCFAGGDCFVEIDLGTLSGGTRQYQMCGGGNNPSPTPVPPTPSPPTPSPPTPSPPTPSPPTPSPPTPSPPTPSPPTPSPPGPSPSGTAGQWLSEHNTRRTQFYAQANMGPLDLKWADSLAASAQNYANTLIGRSGCTISHGYNGDDYGGENLAANWGSGSFAKARTISEVMTAWYDDEINLPSLGAKGHATQIVWRSSHYLGCGQAEKDMGGGQKCFIQVCRYIANGNCYADTNNWMASVLSPDISRRCNGDQCESLPEGCF